MDQNMPINTGFWGHEVTKAHQNLKIFIEWEIFSPLDMALKFFRQTKNYIF